jgi:hypothetical protein
MSTDQVRAETRSPPFVTPFAAVIPYVIVLFSRSGGVNLHPCAT